MFGRQQPEPVDTERRRIEDAFMRRCVEHAKARREGDEIAAMTAMQQLDDLLDEYLRAVRG